MTKNWVRSTLFTGFVALLPLGLLVIILIWLFGLALGIVEPITNLLGTPGVLTGIISLGVLLLVILIFGAIVRTRLGSWFFKSTERFILNNIPGYKSIKQVMEPFVGSAYKKSFKSVALVQVYENSALMTAFVTDNHDNGYTTVFIPTGPNPTSGQIYHLKNKYVHPIDISVSKVLHTILSVGKGSKKILEAYEAQKKK